MPSTTRATHRPPFVANPDVQPFPHQAHFLTAGEHLDEAALFWRVGTGKTYAVLTEAVRDWCADRIDALVVVAPNEVHKRTWVEQQIPKHVRIPHTAEWYVAKSAAGKAKWAALEGLLDAPGLRILTTYYEALASKTGHEFVQDFVRQAGRVLMVLDESHRIMAPGSLAATRLAKLSPKTARRRILTATPTGNGLENLYSQFRFLGQHILGVSTYAEYKGMFCVEVPIPGTDHKKIAGYRNVKYLNKRLAPYVFVAKKPEGLPPVHYVEHAAEMSAEQWKAYRDLVVDYQTELRTGKWVEADLSIVRYRRLQQIVAGHITVPNEDGRTTREVLALECPRIDLLLDVVRGAPDKVIVWAEEQYEIGRICRALDLAQVGNVAFYGQVRKADRGAALDRFDHDKDCKVLVANTATGGTGFQLTGVVAPVGDAVFYSHNWSRIIREQCEGRNHRPGAWAETCVYHDLVARGTVDAKIIRRRKLKDDVAQLIADPQGFAAMLDPDLDYELAAPGEENLTFDP